eukprot:222678-Pyramimonas_sp.AAC.1
MEDEEKAWVECFETMSGIVNARGRMVKHREDKWASWWTPNPHQSRCLHAGLNELRSLVMVSLEKRPPLNLRGVARACTCFCYDGRWRRPLEAQYFSLGASQCVGNVDWRPEYG